MPLIKKTLAHCLWMSELDENYARKAAKWYGQMLEAPDLLPRFEKELAARGSARPMSKTPATSDPSKESR